MTVRLALIALTGLALVTPAAAEEYKLEDVLVSGLREGRVVATGRTDDRGAFRLEFPATPTSGDQICFSGPSVRAAIEPVRYGDDNETLLRRGRGALPGPAAGDPQRLEPLVELLVVIALDGRPQGGEQRLVVPGARVRPGQARSADLDLCYRPFVNVSGDPRPGGAQPTTRQDASGPRTTLPGSSGAAQATRSEPVYVTNSDGTITILELLPTNPSSGAGSDGRPGADVTGDGRLQARDRELPPRDDGVRWTSLRTDPRIPPPSARSGPAAPAPSRGVVVTGTVSLVESRR